VSGRPDELTRRANCLPQRDASFLRKFFLRNPRENRNEDSVPREGRSSMVKRLLLSALLVSWVVPAWAAPPARTKPTHTPSHTIVKTRLLKPQAAPARAGQKAAVDPETKKLREPAPDEQQPPTPPTA